MNGISFIRFLILSRSGDDPYDEIDAIGKRSVGGRLRPICVLVLAVEGQGHPQPQHWVVAGPAGEDPYHCHVPIPAERFTGRVSEPREGFQEFRPGGFTLPRGPGDQGTLLWGQFWGRKTSCFENSGKPPAGTHLAGPPLLGKVIRTHPLNTPLPSGPNFKTFLVQV